MINWTLRLLLFTAVGCAVALTGTNAQENRKPIATIDGAKHPELIPEELMWETAFRTLWATATYPGDQPTPSGIKTLATRAFHIPEPDVQKVLTITQETLNRLTELREPFEREHTTGKSLGWTDEARTKRGREIGEVIVEGRDQLVCSLGPGSFKAVKQWLSRTIVPGIKVDIYGDQTK